MVKYNIMYNITLALPQNIIIVINTITICWSCAIVFDLYNNIIYI
jgi:hypothetical protein